MTGLHCTYNGRARSDHTHAFADVIRKGASDVFWQTAEGETAYSDGAAITHNLPNQAIYDMERFISLKKNNISL